MALIPTGQAINLATLCPHLSAGHHCALSLQSKHLRLTLDSFSSVLHQHPGCSVPEQIRISPLISISSAPISVAKPYCFSSSLLYMIFVSPPSKYPVFIQQPEQAFKIHVLSFLASECSLTYLPLPQGKNPSLPPRQGNHGRLSPPQGTPDSQRGHWPDTSALQGETATVLGNWVG